MFFAIIYCGAGIYVILMALGVIHKEFKARLDRPRRLGIMLLGGGLIVLGLYYGYHAYFFSTPAGKDYQRLQRDLERGYIQRNR